MKTADEFLKIWKGEEATITEDIAITAMKEYAKQVAEQALKYAAENAIYVTVGDQISIVKSSITNTKIELP